MILAESSARASDVLFANAVVTARPPQAAISSGG